MEDTVVATDGNWTGTSGN